MKKRLTYVLTACAVFLSACAGNQSASHHKSGKYQTGHTKTYAGGYHPAVGKLPASDMPLVVNDRVIKWVNYFTNGKGRDSFARYLQRSGKFLPMMRESLRRKGMPQDLVYLALIESGFRNDAKSHASAVGTWQFIRSTGLNYGLDIDSFIDERRDPEKAVTAAASYLNTLHSEFGDWYLAMAGYNAGEGRIRQAVRECGSKNFWDITNARCVLRPETQDYVPKYIAATIIAKNPKQFGFTGIDYHAPLNYETVTIDGQADLDTVAEAAGVPSNAVKDLNADLHAGITPPGGHVVKVPVGTAHKVQRNLAKMASQPRTVMVGYTVRRGETLEQIARKQGVNAKQLMSINGLKSRKVARGTVLNVPRDHVMRAKVVAVNTSPAIARMVASVEPSKRTPRGYKASRNAVADAAQTREPAVSQSMSPVATREAIAPIVGESVMANPADRSGVAAVIGQDTREQPSMYSAPERARVVPTAVAVAEAATPAVTTVAAADTAAPLAESHQVARGDSLGKIARMYNIAEADLRRWNNLNKGERLAIGTGVRLTDPAAVVAQVDPVAPTVTEDPLAENAPSTVVTTAPADLAVSSVSERVAGVNVPRVAAVANPRSKKSILPTQHKVARGDTLTAIAKRYGVAQADLRRWNKLSSGTVRVGQTIQLTGNTASNGKNIEVASRVAMNTAPAKSAKATTGKSVVHNVKPGDTLWVLAKRYKVTPDQIQTWNKMSGKQALKPGQKLTIRL